MLWRKTFWLIKCDFCRLFQTKRSWHAYWFSAVIVSGRHDLSSDARAFFLWPLLKCKVLHCGEIRVLGGLISLTCLLDLNNYKRFSFCPWKWRFPVMYCIVLFFKMYEQSERCNFKTISSISSCIRVFSASLPAIASGEKPSAKRCFFDIAFFQRTNTDTITIRISLKQNQLLPLTKSARTECEQSIENIQASY